MSSAVCTAWLLMTVTAAAPEEDWSVAPEPARLVEYQAAAESAPMVVAVPMAGQPAPMPMAPFVRHCGYQGPGLASCLGTSCHTRCYAGANIVYHRRPYDYRIQFDYPWYIPASSLGGACGGHVPTMIAPLPSTRERQDTAQVSDRRSAIRRVD
jgi:hypothetical protein